MVEVCFVENIFHQGLSSRGKKLICKKIYLAGRVDFLKEKNAIITGAAAGIGRALALRLAKEGTRVILLDLDLAGLQESLQQVLENGGSGVLYEVDIRDSRRIAEIVDDIMDQFGKIDILVNNAAIYYQQPDGSNKRTRFIDSSEETWRLVMDVNLLGTMSVTQAVLRKMVGNGSGKIINIGSVAGVNGIVNMVDYSASKGAIIAFTRALAQEVAEYKININCVSPGSIDVGRGGPQTFLGRMGSPDEVADLVSFLAGSAADFITGQNYIIDGGRTLSMKCE